MVMSVDLEHHELMNKRGGYFESAVVENVPERTGRKPSLDDLDTHSEPASAKSSPPDSDRRTSWLVGINGNDAKGSLKFFHERRSSDEPVTAPRSESAERPALIRKKSGELVKSSLKLPTLSRTRSMPNTKTVHFDSNLEHVRRFNYREKPAKVSFEWGGEETADESDDDDDHSEDEDSKGWSISTPNFKAPNYDRVEGKDRPHVYLDSLYLSPDKMYLRGNVCVRNISFAKRVTIRYTIDYWQTLSEVEAHYNSDIRRLDRAAGYDRFSFQIPLATLPGRVLRKASLFLCARYSVDQKVFWDNNSKLNYEVVFHRGSHRDHHQHHQKRMSAPPHFVSRSFSSDDAFPCDDFNTGLASTPSEIFKSVALETRDAGVKLSSSKEPSELKSRYSFGSAFSQPLRSPLNGGSDLTAPKSADGRSNGNLTSTAVDGSGSPTQKAPAKRVFPAAAPTQFSWDSTGYQDILSKFCFAGAENSSPPDTNVAEKRQTSVPSKVSTPVSPAASPGESPPLEASKLQRTTSYSALKNIRPAHQRPPALQHG